MVSGNAPGKNAGLDLSKYAWRKKFRGIFHKFLFPCKSFQNMKGFYSREKL